MIEKERRETSQVESELVLRAARTAAGIEEIVSRWSFESTDVLQNLKLSFRREKLSPGQRSFALDVLNRFEAHRNEIKDYEESIGIVDKPGEHIDWFHHDNLNLRRRFLKDAGLSETTIDDVVERVGVLRGSSYYITLHLYRGNLKTVEDIWRDLGKKTEVLKNVSGWVDHRNNRIHPLLQNKIIWEVDRDDVRNAFAGGDARGRRMVRQQFHAHELSHIFEFIYFPFSSFDPLEGMNLQNYIDFRFRSELSASYLNGTINPYRIFHNHVAFYGEDKVGLLGENTITKMQQIKTVLSNKEVRVPYSSFKNENLNARTLSLIILFSRDLSTVVRNLENLRENWYFSGKD